MENSNKNSFNKYSKASSSSLLYIILIIFVLFPSSNCIAQFKVPKILWCFWQGNPIDSTNQILQLFYNNHKHYASNWDIRYLNSTTMWQWLNRVPDFPKSVLNNPSFYLDTTAKRANLIRLALLKQFGGVWIDMSIIFIQKLDWIHNIDFLEQTQFKHNNQPQLFLISDFMLKNDPQNSPTSVYFMAAKPKTQFIQLWYDRYMYEKVASIWLYSPLHMLQGGSYTKINAAKEGYNINNDPPYFQMEFIYQQLIRKKQKQLDEIAKKNNKTRVLATQYYKIRTINGDQGPYKLKTIKLDKNNQNRDYSTQVLMRISQDKLRANQQGMKFFIKLIHKDRAQLAYYLNQGCKYWKRASQKQQNKCSLKYYIHKESYGYKYLLETYSNKFYNNPVIDYQIDQSQFSEECRIEQLEWPALKCQYAQQYLSKGIKYVMFGTILILAAIFAKILYFGKSVKFQEAGSREQEEMGVNGRNKDFSQN